MISFSYAPHVALKGENLLKFIICINSGEIKAAYKKLARSLHPDVNKDDTPEQALKKFQHVQKAYEKLMDVKGAPHRDDLLEVCMLFHDFVRMVPLFFSYHLLFTICMYNRSGPSLCGEMGI